MVGDDNQRPGLATRAVRGGGAGLDPQTVEQRVALLEGGVAAVAAPSGPLLLTLALLPLMRPGDQVIAARQFALADALVTMAPAFGWDMHFADVDDLGSFERAVSPKTQAVLVASMAESGEIADLAAFASLVKRARVPLLVDNSLLTPALCRPFEFGADIVIHADARYLAGEPGATGFVVDGGRFSWSDVRRYPAITQPRTGEREALAESIGNFAYAAACRELAGGAPLAAAESIARGLETLQLRMSKHAANARAVAEFLAGHRQVISIAHAALPGDRHHALAQRYCSDGTGALVGFVVEGGSAGAERVLERVALITPHREVRSARSALALASWGDTGPAGMLRLSVGLEDAVDIVEDLRQALSET